MPPELPAYERFARHFVTTDLAFLRNDELVFVSDITGQFNIWAQEVGRAGRPGRSRALTYFRNRSVRRLEPSRDQHTLYLMADEDGTEQFHIYRLDTRGGEPVLITKHANATHHLSRGALDRSGRWLLYCSNARSPADLDIVVHDLRTGALRHPFPAGSMWYGPLWDWSSERISALQFLTPQNARSFVHDLRSKTTTEVLPHDESAVVEVVGWTADGRSLIALTNLGSEFSRVELVDWRTGVSRTLVNPGADVDFARYSARARRLLFAVNRDGNHTLWYGPLAGPFRKVRGLPRGNVTTYYTWEVDLSPDGTSLAASWGTGTAPSEIRWLRLGASRSERMTDNMPGGVPGGPLPAPKIVRIPSSDGLRIPAIYYLPKRRPGERLPAVVSIHGGPEEQERPGWMYRGLYAYLNAVGIAVLAPNIRGSTGFGKSYQRLIYRDWGGGELRDLRAVAEWLGRRPEIDPRRLGVFGASFGGFAALSCLSRLPAYWRAGVDFWGPSNLVTLAKAAPPFWHRFIRELIGDPETEAQFLRERSPVAYLNDVRAALLIVQGTNDPRVPKSESDQVVEKLRALGRHVDYLVFPDEGHTFTRTENILKANEAAAKFLHERLTHRGPSPA